MNKKRDIGSGLILIIKNVIVHFVKENTFSFIKFGLSPTLTFSNLCNSPLSIEHLFPSHQNVLQVLVPSFLKLQENSYSFLKKGVVLSKHHFLMRNFGCW